MPPSSASAPAVPCRLVSTDSAFICLCVSGPVPPDPSSMAPHLSPSSWTYSTAPGHGPPMPFGERLDHPCRRTTRAAGPFIYGPTPSMAVVREKMHRRCETERNESREIRPIFWNRSIRHIDGIFYYGSDSVPTDSSTKQKK
jgi:hypothetical protein